MNLYRGIKRWDLVALILNGVIGAGIFGLPSEIFSLTQSYSVIVVVLCGILIGFIILCFAEVSSRFSLTGGPYLYAFKAFGKVIGYEMGWLMWLTRISAFAAVCNLLLSYVAFFWSPASISIWRLIIIISIIGAMTIINYIGIKQSILFSNIFTISKLIPIVLFIVIGLYFVDLENFVFDKPPKFQSFSTSIMIMVFAFGGFELSTISAGEIKNPRSNFPQALFISMIIITILYVLIQVVCIGNLGDLSHSGSPLADAAFEFTGILGASIISIGAIISMIGALNATYIACTRLPFAMSEQKQGPSMFASIHNKYRTPHMAIILSSLAILAVTISYSFMSAVKIHVIIKLITYILVCISLPIFRKKEDIKSAKFVLKGGNLISLISVLICIWLLINTSLKEALSVGVAVIIGFILYIINNYNRKF